MRVEIYRGVGLTPRGIHYRRSVSVKLFLIFRASIWSEYTDCT